MLATGGDLGEKRAPLVFADTLTLLLEGEQTTLMSRLCTFLFAVAYKCVAVCSQASLVSLTPISTL